MRTCPSEQELDQLLNEELNDSRHDAVSKHIGSCTSCQTALERLTEASDELKKASFLSENIVSTPSAGLPDSQAAFLAQLKESPPSPLANVAPDAGHGKPSWNETPVVSGYEILGELGRGGMGVVYKARHLALDRVVALKMILAGSHAGPKDRARFHQEAAAIARLHHPNIVQVFDIGNAGGCPYFALEFVEKGSLASHLRGEPQPLATILPLMETLARTMAYAHQCGIIHRDLKPANILLSANDEAKDGKESLSSFVVDRKYVPKITDFGLAKRLNEEAAPSHSEEVLGTPNYMSPEQADAKSREISPATDVYALGAIFYEILTGRPPFKGANSLETLLQVLHEEPVRPSRLRAKLPQDVETICLKCLEKVPEHRYASAVALADDLRRFRRGDPIEARPVGLLERGWKLARRRPVSVALVAGIVLVTLLGFTGVTWEWRVAVREWNEKEFQRQQARNALYFSRIAQSQLQWRVNDLPGALRSLEDCKPRLADLHDRRGWEWYYLQRLYRPELFSLRHTHSGVEGNVAFDPTGRTIASVVSFAPDNESERGELRIWDAISMKLVYEWKLRSPFHRLAYRPDGQRLALGSSDGKILVWDTQTYRELWQDSLANSRITSLTFRGDGKTLATATMGSTDSGKGGEIKLWDADTGTSQTLPSAVEGGGFHGVAFHPKLPLLASGGEDSSVRIWDIRSCQEIRPPLSGHKSPVYGVAFSPDGKLLVSAGSNGELKIWNLEQETDPPQAGEASGGFPKGRIVPQSLTGRTGAILSLAFSPDGQYFAYCGTDKTVRVWNVDSGTGTITYRGHTAGVEGAQFSPDGQRLLSCSPAQGEVKVWDLTRHPEFSNLVRTTGDPDHLARDVENIAFHEDGLHLVSVTVVGGLQIWDAFSGVLRAQHPLPISAGPLELGGMWAAFTPDGRRLAARCGEDPRLLRIWDVDRGKELLNCQGHCLPIFCVRFSSDGRYVASCACDETPAGKPFEIKVWDAAAGKVLAEMSGAGRVLALAFSPDNRWLAAGNDDRLRVYDWARGREAFAAAESGGHSRITALAFRPDGGLIASATVNPAEIHLCDSAAWASSSHENRQPLRRLAAPPLLCDLAFSPDGARLAGASRDLIKMWDVETGGEVLTLRGAPQRYRDPPFNARVVFSADGTRLAGTNWNESISVWDAPMPAEEKERLRQEATRRKGAEERASFWHLQEAEYCADHKLTYGAIFHLHRLGDAPLPTVLQERRQRIRAKMEKETK